MKINIFAEGSGTKQEDTEIPFREFYQGSFITVSNLIDQLYEYGDIQLHILSEEFGLVRGEENVDRHIPQSDAIDENQGEFLRKILEKAADADVVIILLSSSKFDSLIVKNWKDITERAKPNSVWCLGAARSSLEVIDFEPLYQIGCEIITYQRVGVARIDNETRKDLMRKIEVLQSK